jgi:hypothetical protein
MSNETLEQDKTQKRKTNKKPVQAKRIWKGHQTFVSDLFKCELSTMKKNISFKYGEPKIEDVEHVHFFRTFNSQGRKQIFTNPVGNHYHKVTVEEDENGNLVAKCGPALHKVTVKGRNGRKRKIEKYVSWDDDTDLALKEGREVLKDEHTHEMTYLRSEELNADSNKKMKNTNAAEIIAANEKMQSGVYNGTEISMRPA